LISCSGNTREYIIVIDIHVFGSTRIIRYIYKVFED
jgi:hypothetical protein